MKRGFLQTLSIFSILMINFVSASFHYSYGRFSFRSFIDTFDPAVLTLIFLFIIFLVVLNNLVFIDFFRGQRAPAIVVSALISFLSVYWMYQKGWYLEQPLIFPILIASMIFGVIALILTKVFRINRAFSAIIAGVIAGVVAFGTYDSGFGISGDILYPIISLLLTLGVIILIWKKRFTWFLIILGLALLMTTVFTDIFYEEGIVAFIGFVLLAIGSWLWWRNRKKRTLSLPKGVKPYMPFRGPRRSRRTGGLRTLTPPQQPPQTPQSSPQPQPTVKQIRKDKNRLARKLGITKLLSTTRNIM